MTLDEAIASVGKPVLIHDHPRTLHAVIVSVEPRRRYQVKLRVHRRRFPWDLMPRPQWWPPNRLSLKEN